MSLKVYQQKVDEMLKVEVSIYALLSVQVVWRDDYLVVEVAS